MGCLDDDVPEERASALEIEQMRQAEGRWQQFQNVYMPHEIEWISDSLQRGSNAQRESNVIDAINASNGPSMAAAPNTTSGALKAAAVARESEQAGAMTAAGNAGFEATEQQYEDMLQRIVGLGRNTSHMSDKNLNTASAIQAAEQASDASIATSRKNANSRLLGNAIGATGAAMMLRRPELSYHETDAVPDQYNNNYSGGNVDPNQYGGYV
jgi:hypothetical protein